MHICACADEEEDHEEEGLEVEQGRLRNNKQGATLAFGPGRGREQTIQVIAYHNAEYLVFLFEF